MPFFHKLSLTGKVVALVALLGSLALTITVYSLTHLRTVDRGYRALLEREARAAVLVTAATNDLNYASRLVYAVLTEQEEERMRAALAMLAAQQISFHGKIETVRPLLPAAATQLDAIHAQEVQLFKLAADIVETAARWRGDLALDIIHRQFDPLLVWLRQNMDQVRNDTTDRFQTASHNLGAATGRTLRNSALAFGAALIAIIGLAIWISLTQIARPIKDLTRSMERLTQRDYQQAIGHTARQDEVGQMAQALEVFRSALQHSDYLEVAKAEAERLAHAKSSFLATMSHEIRTPLNAIIGLAHSSLRRPLAADQKGRLRNIQRAGEHLLGVINDILDFSKIEGGFLQAEAVPFAAPQLLDDVRAVLSAKAAEKSLVLITDSPSDLPLLLGDPQRIRQILFNFTSNAIKFSERGTVRLHLSLRQDQGQWFLYGEVRDQGIGLSAAQIKDLFQPFQQADASTNRRYGGTGLGLAISRSLAEMLGGSVGVQSEPGRGSNFWFRVAVQKAPPGVAPVAATQQGAVSPNALRGLRVLLVDDNALNRLVGRELLADADIQCDEGQDGQHAIDILERAADGTYDLVLMDMMMPGLDGCTATRLLRQNPRFAQLPIIAMTANTSQQDVDTCLAAGMQALVPKPIDEQILWNTLLAHCVSATDRAPPLAVGEATAKPGKTSLANAPQAPEGFDLPAALARLGNDEALYGRLVRMFTAQPHDEPARAHQALAQGDGRTASRHLHTLQGQAATLGAIALQQAAKQAEQAIENQLPHAELQALLGSLELRLRSDVLYLQSVLQQSAGVEDNTSPPAESPPQNVPRLLIVDDEASNALTLQRIFRTDCAVFVAHSGTQALAFCQDNPLPDLILLDIVMPGMDGLEVCRRLKADALTADIPILFVTAQSTPQEESAALAAGGVDFISKPINHVVVRARVQTHLMLKAQSDQLRQSALCDGLTGIANRRHFDEALAREWRRGQRHQRPLALFLIDIDYFKKFNDHYGHLAGDECLRTVARTLQQQLKRGGDVAARYGGEEFACLLSNIQPEDALSKAQALCRSVAAMRLPHATSPVAPHVTISVGVALWFFDREGTPTQLLAAADAALYVAKNAGRNRASGRAWSPSQLPSTLVCST